MRTLIIAGIVVAGIGLVGLVVLAQSLYVVDVTQRVLILRFGEVVTQRPDPGLYAKSPFVDTVVRFDKRVLRIDAPPVAMPDREKENLVIDSYARYRIVDPVQFRRTLQSEVNARSRLGDIVTASLRSEIARRDRIEIIGSQTDLDENGFQKVNAEGIPQYVGTETRSEILANVLEKVKRVVREQEEAFGIELIDVRIKRVDFPDEVSHTIYTRMREERNRIATGIRADGEGQASRIRIEAEGRKNAIIAEAQGKVNALMAERETRAIDALIEALTKQGDLSSYGDSLEAFKVARGLASR